MTHTWSPEKNYLFKIDQNNHAVIVKMVMMVYVEICGQIITEN